MSGKFVFGLTGMKVSSFTGSSLSLTEKPKPETLNPKPIKSPFSCFPRTLKPKAQAIRRGMVMVLALWADPSRALGGLEALDLGLRICSGTLSQAPSELGTAFF